MINIVNSLFNNVVIDATDIGSAGSISIAKRLKIYLQLF